MCQKPQKHTISQSESYKGIVLGRRSRKRIDLSLMEVLTIILVVLTLVLVVLTIVLVIR